MPKKGDHNSEETRKKMVEHHWSKRGITPPNLGKSFSEEHKQKISISCKEKAKSKPKSALFIKTVRERMLGIKLGKEKLIGDINLVSIIRIDLEVMLLIGKVE